MRINLLSGGAAQGLVQELAARFKSDTGHEVGGTFGAVGAMRDELLGGAPADLVILTAALVGELARDGRVVADSVIDIGAVPTCIAVRSGDSLPPVGDADALREALSAAGAIYFPDPTRATAGIHFVKVLDALRIAGEVAARLRPHPNGAAAMRALAVSNELRPIGCTQATEILNTAGTALVGPLPPGHALATVYAAGVCSGAAEPEAARAFAKLLAHPETAMLRRRLGFTVE